MEPSAFSTLMAYKAKYNQVLFKYIYKLQLKELVLMSKIQKNQQETKLNMYKIHTLHADLVTHKNQMLWGKIKLVSLKLKDFQVFSNI